MSCNNRRKHFLNQMAGDSSVAAALGGGDATQAAQTLEAIYQRSGASGAKAAATLDSKKLERDKRDCTALFLKFKEKGIDLPTHSKPQPGNPVPLPETQTMGKYAELHRTLKAAQNQKPLPPVAAAIVRQQAAMRAVAPDRANAQRNRCRNCGQYASIVQSHNCPLTATATSMERALAKRLGVPTGAYTDSSGRNALDDLIKEAAQKGPNGLPIGTVRFVKPATGETVDATLDGSLLALQQGYLPQSWQNNQTLKPTQVVTQDGKVVSVIDPKGMSAPTPPANPVEQAALASGLDPAWVKTHTITKRNDATPLHRYEMTDGRTATIGISPDGTATMFSLHGRNPLEMGKFPTQVEAEAYLATLKDPNHVHNANLMTTAAATSSLISSSPSGIPAAVVGSGSVAAVGAAAALAQTNVGGVPSGSSSSGGGVPVVGAGAALPKVGFSLDVNSTGSEYDSGRWTGHEFRGGRGAGKPIVDGNRTYQVGETSFNPSDYGTARRQGLYPQPPRNSGIKVGQDLVAAAVLLKDAKLVETAKMTDGRKIYELQTTQDGVVAAYDPQNEVVGSVYSPTNAKGIPTSSPEQMAAMIAYMASNPTTPAQQALATDVRDYLNGTTSALAVSDGAYIAIRESYEKTPGLTYEMGRGMGGVTRCPNCGRFVGSTPCQCTPAGASQATATNTATTIAVGAGAGTTGATATSTAPTPVATPAPTPQETPQMPPLNPTEAQAQAQAQEDAPTPVVEEFTPTPAPAPVVVIPFDSEQFARTLGETLAANFPAQAQAPAPTNSEEVKEALTRMSDAITALAGRNTQTEERMAGILDGIATRLASAPAPAPAPALAPALAPASLAPASTGGTPTSPEAAGQTTSGSRSGVEASVPQMPPQRKPAPPMPVRPPLDQRTNPVEHMLKYVEPPVPPDPYLMEVDPTLGGQRLEPLPLYYQNLDPNFTISEDTERAIRTVSASLQLAWNPDETKRPKGTQFRAFAFGGTSGTGKNTTARQIAAGLRMPYYEMTINKDTSIQEEIGQTVLTTDPQTGSTISKAQLGKLGQAAASGAVICVNELVKANPGILGALQTMMEDGYIEIAGTEAGMKGGRIPVHPSTVFIGTFNPGYDGAAQRPDAALLSRMNTLMLNAPSVDEQSARLQKEINSLFGIGGFSSSSGSGSGSGAGDAQSDRAAEILARDYKNRVPSNISPEKANAAASFVSDLQRMARGSMSVGRQIATASAHPSEPTPREAARFLATAEATGDPLLAVEQFKVYCDAGEEFDEQWGVVKQAFSRYYDDDGQGINRREAGLGPEIN